MRITNRMITSKYLTSLNSISSDLSKLNAQVSSGRAFSRASENTSAAIRAFQVRREMSNTEGYNSNILHAQSTLTNSESSLSHIEELMQTAQTKVLQGKNGTQSFEERKIIATELRNIQDQLLQTLNSSDSNIYYFGGTSSDSKPFTLGADGKLAYNGATLDTIIPADAETAAADSLYIDIGLNVKLDASGAVDKNSVFSYSIPGIKIVGSGATTLGIIDKVTGLAKDTSNNLYDLIGEIATEFESANYNGDNADKLLGHLQKGAPKVINAITEVGAKTSYLDFMNKRLEAKTLNNEERQLAIEGADPAKTIISFKSQEAAYNAALQMGTKIIQPSIFDYMS